MHRLPQLMLTAPLVLCIGMAEAQDKTFNINIPAQTLSTALDALAKQTGLQPFYADGIMAGKRSPAVSGRLSPQQALDKLVAGSGLVYTFTAPNAVALKPESPQLNQAEPKTMPVVKVVGSAINDVTDPYNQDYVIPNATAGTKTDTPIMETPLNVQVISKQVLKDQQVIRLKDALKNVSGVTTAGTSQAGGFGGTQQQLFFRGFSSQTFFRNGFRLQDGSASRGMANLESIEVLKGPAAILYGLVEPGGMVNVITKQPQATPYYGMTQQFGSYDLYRTTIDATGPLTQAKDLLYRMNLSYENSGSFRDLEGKEDVFFSPVLKWNISPKTQVTLEMEYNRQHLAGANGYIPFVNGKLLNVPISRNYGEYSPLTLETIFGSFNWSHQFNDDWAIKHSFTVNQYNNAGTIIRPEQTILPGDPDNPDVTSPAVGRSRSFHNNQSDTYSTNLDLTGHFDTFGLKHTLLLGGDYYRTYQTASNDTNFSKSLIDANNPVHPGTPFLPFTNTNPYVSTVDQYGLYIQDQIKLPYNVYVMGGIRYQYIHQNSLNRYHLVFAPDNIFDGSDLTVQTQDAVTPRVGILWQPQNWLSLYANYVESFGANTGRTLKSPGITQAIAPTSAAQYEGGIKATFFDGRLRANLAYYDLTKTNVAVSDPNQSHDCGGGGGDCMIAVGAIRSRGPELDITGEILPGWNMIATWSNIDILVTKTNNTEGGDTGGYSIGSRLANVPRNTGSLWSTYEIQAGDFKGLKAGSGVTLQDRQPGGPAGTLATPGFATVALMAGYSRDVGKAKVSVQLNIDNLLDKRYFSNISSTKDLNDAFVDFGTPRTFTGSISVQY